MEAAEHLAEVRLIKGQVDANTEKIIRIEKAVFGNGEPGMDEVIRSTKTMLEAYIKDQKEQKEKESKKKDAIQMVILSAVVGNVITMIITIIQLINAGVIK